MKSNKGITLLTLAITIVVLSIITGTVVFQSLEGIESQKVSKLYNDLRNVQDKVNIYYTEYDSLPTGNTPFTANLSFTTDESKNPNDSGNYYVVNLQSLKNLTLGMDISGENDDVFVVNEDSHTVYYPKGLEVNGKTYYTLPNTYTVVN